MPARDLAEPYPHVTTDAPAADAVRLLAERNLPALLVLDTDGVPYAVVPGSQLVGQLVPEYVMEDPLLAAVIDDRHADDLAEELAGLTVSEWLPRRTFKPPYVGPDAECSRSPRSWPARTSRSSPLSSTAAGRTGYASSGW